jgi:UDP:flavonoid glycosyltransferase YjiC (YdhE family)
MVEAISAGVPVIVFPSQGEAERRSHAKRLESLDCVKVVERAAELSGALDECLSQNLSGRSPKLAMNGASVIANCILKDLS